MKTEGVIPLHSQTSSYSVWLLFDIVYTVKSVVWASAELTVEGAGLKDGFVIGRVGGSHHLVWVEHILLFGATDRDYRNSPLIIVHGVLQNVLPLVYDHPSDRSPVHHRVVNLILVRKCSDGFYSFVNSMAEYDREDPHVIRMGDNTSYAKGPSGILKRLIG